MDQNLMAAPITLGPLQLPQAITKGLIRQLEPLWSTQALTTVLRSQVPALIKRIRSLGTIQARIQAYVATWMPRPQEPLIPGPIQLKVPSVLVLRTTIQALITRSPTLGPN